MNERKLIITLLLAVSLPAAGQRDEAQQQLRRERFSRIDYWHVGVGADAAFGPTACIGPKVFGGFGSCRNLLMVDAGLKLQWLNPFAPTTEEHVSQRQLPLFIQAGVNVLRWHQGALYVGGELAYHMQLGASHCLPKGGITESDDRLARSHAAATARIGLRQGRWDIALTWQRDLAPAYRQQYVYESAAYDYDTLHDPLFERQRFGIALAYIFPF